MSEQHEMDCKKMSGTLLKNHIRQINRLLARDNLPSDLIAKKQQRLHELEEEMSTRPSAEVRIAENIKRIKEANKKHGLSNRTVTYIELHKALKKVKTLTSALKQLEAIRDSKLQHTANSANSHQSNHISASGDSNDSEVSDSPSHNDGENAEDTQLSYRNLSIEELKTKIGQTKHHLERAKGDVVYITYYPIKEHKYISLYPIKEIPDIKLRSEIRKEILSQHTYEETLQGNQSKQKWIDFDKSKELKKQQELDREQQQKEEQNRPQDPKPMNRKARRAALATFGNLTKKTNDSSIQGDSEAEDDFFNDNAEEGQKMEGIQSSRMATSSSQGAANRSKPEKNQEKKIEFYQESKNGFQAPQEDAITSAEFFGDDWRYTGRKADAAWEVQQERAQKTGDRKWRFLPSAPDYLTSRGRKRYRNENEDDVSAPTAKRHKSAHHDSKHNKSHNKSSGNHYYNKKFEQKPLKAASPKPIEEGDLIKKKRSRPKPKSN